MKKDENLLIQQLQEKLLQVINAGSDKKKHCIGSLENFLERVSEEYEIKDTAVEDLVEELRTDLAYFQPNAVIRLTDKDLLNENQLITRLKECLNKLDKKS